MRSLLHHVAAMVRAYAEHAEEETKLKIMMFLRSPYIAHLQSVYPDEKDCTVPLGQVQE